MDTNSQPRNYSFSCNTSNHFLRSHIVNWHLEEYLKLAKKEDWSVQIDAVRIAQSTGYSLRAIQQAIQEGHKLTVLPELRSNSSDSQPRRFPSSDNTPAIPEFSLTALQEYLVKFIVADDQVCIAQPLCH